MKCPKCKAEMKRTKHGDVAIDSCDLCYGIWLDKGELEKVSATKAENLEKAKHAINSMINTDLKVIEEKSYNCPLCDKEMQKMQFNTKEKIIVDTCSACEGKWFDSGEMILVTEAASSSASNTAKSQKNVSLLPSILTILLVLTVAIAVTLWVFANFK